MEGVGLRSVSFRSYTATAHGTTPACRDRREELVSASFWVTPASRAANFTGQTQLEVLEIKPGAVIPVITRWSPIKICFFGDVRHTILCVAEWTARG